MPTVNNQNVHTQGANAPYTNSQAGADNRRHSTGSGTSQRLDGAFNLRDLANTQGNNAARADSIRRIASSPALPTTTDAADGEPRNATADRLKAAGFGIASASMFAQLTGVIASILLAALGAVVVPFIVPLIVVTIAVAFIGAALMAIGTYIANKDAPPTEGAASAQIEDPDRQETETNVDDLTDIAGAAAATGNRPQVEFDLPRPAGAQFPETFLSKEQIEHYITRTSKAHYKGLNAEQMRAQQATMDGMRNMTLPTPDGGTERVNMFRFMDTFPNLGHVVNVEGNQNGLVSKLNSAGLPHLGYATQFPRFGQMGDFLQVIVQEEIGLVNPISQPKDIRQHNLYPYWLPENGRSHRASDGRVYQLESRQIGQDNPDYQAGSGKSLYQLTISWTDENGQPQIHTLGALHIDNWQDHGAVGVPELKGYVQARLENEGPVKGKILTHCTAGVGRTGTVIAAQNMMEHPEIPLIDVVDAIRERRNHACVQSVSQAELLAELNMSLKEKVDTQGDEPPALPPKQSRQPIMQPDPRDLAADDSPRLPRRASTPRPQFGGVRAMSRHQLLKVKIEAAMQDQVNFDKLVFVPEGEDGKAQVRALTPGDKRVFIWPSNSMADKFAYGIMTATGQPLYYLMDEKASFETVRADLGKQLDR